MFVNETNGTETMSALYIRSRNLTPSKEMHPKPHFRASWEILTSMHACAMHVLVQEGLWKPLFYDSVLCHVSYNSCSLSKENHCYRRSWKTETENTPNIPVQLRETFAFSVHVLLSWNWVTKALRAHKPSLPLNWLLSWQWQIFCLKTQDVRAVFTSVAHQFYQPQLLKTEL